MTHPDARSGEQPAGAAIQCGQSRPAQYVDTQFMSVLRPNGCLEISKARQLDGWMRGMAKTGHTTGFQSSPYSRSLSVTTTQKQRSRPSPSATWQHGLATARWFNSGGFVFTGCAWECRRAVLAYDPVAGGRPGGARGLAAKTLAANAPPSPARAGDGGQT
jgi:hypothetical protein